MSRASALFEGAVVTATATNATIAKEIPHSPIRCWEQQDDSRNSSNNKMESSEKKLSDDRKSWEENGRRRNEDRSHQENVGDFGDMKITAASSTTAGCIDGAAVGESKAQQPKRLEPYRRNEMKKQYRKAKRSRNTRYIDQGDGSGGQSDVEVIAQIVPLNMDGEIVGSSRPTIQTKDNTPKNWLRIVTPYWYTFRTNAKARWVGRSILDVYQNEFVSHSSSYYEYAIPQGLIQVNGCMVDVNYQVQSHDVLSHKVHRHEPAVLVSSPVAPYIRIAEETDTILAIDKPSTLPIHPCSGYNQNSLLSILTRYYCRDDPRNKLFTIHRLDRLTSGLVLLAKCQQVAAQYAEAIREHDNCEKLYLARVRGIFPQQCPLTATCTSDLDPSCLGDGRPFKRLESRCTDSCFTTDAVLPKCGQWPQQNAFDSKPQSASKGEVMLSKENCSALRYRNAVGWWISRFGGEIAENETLFSFSTQVGTIEQWKEALDDSNNSEAKCENQKATTSTMTKPNHNSLKWFHLACPVRVEQAKKGICAAGAFDNLDDDTYQRTVKPAHTMFALLGYDAASDTSLVLCRPITGRTHQIRLHLQFLCHPIANDPNYGGTSMWYQSPLGQKTCNQAHDSLSRINISSAITDSNPCLALENNLTDNTNVSQTNLHCVIAERSSQYEEDSQLLQLKDNSIECVTALGSETNPSTWRGCVWCEETGGDHVKRSTLEFLVRSPGIWLHALRYKVTIPGQGTTSFCSELPEWARLFARNDEPK